MTSQQHEQVTVLLDGDVFDQLQQLATPLMDDVNSVLRRLLAARELQQGGAGEKAQQVVTIARGQVLPVGLRLRGAYQGHRFDALVTPAGIEYGGVAYDSPSAAARAAKQQAGAREQASHANGWQFWSYVDEETGALLPLEQFRAGAFRQSTSRPRRRSIGAWESRHTDTSILAGEVRPVPRP